MSNIGGKLGFHVPYRMFSISEVDPGLSEKRGVFENCKIPRSLIMLTLKEDYLDPHWGGDGAASFLLSHSSSSITRYNSVP